LIGYPFPDCFTLCFIAFGRMDNWLLNVPAPCNGRGRFGPFYAYPHPTTFGYLPQPDGRGTYTTRCFCIRWTDTPTVGFFRCRSRLCLRAVRLASVVLYTCPTFCLPHRPPALPACAYRLRTADVSVLDATYHHWRLPSPPPPAFPFHRRRCAHHTAMPLTPCHIPSTTTMRRDTTRNCCCRAPVLLSRARLYPPAYHLPHARISLPNRHGRTPPSAYMRATPCSPNDVARVPFRFWHWRSISFRHIVFMTRIPCFSFPTLFAPLVVCI